LGHLHPPKDFPWSAKSVKIQELTLELVVEQQMTKVKEVGKELSAANLVALQSLRVIRRRHNDKVWRTEATADLKKRRRESSEPLVPKGRKSASKREKEEFQEHVIDQAVNSLVEKYLLAGLISGDWNPDGKEPLPEHPNSRGKFSKATGISEGHLRQIEEGKTEFTLDDLIACARAGDMDIATFLTPALEDLESTEYFPLEPINPRVGQIYIFEWLMWLRGYRKLPGQNEDSFIKFTSEPHPLMTSFDDSRKSRWQDEVDRERILIEESKVYVGHLINDGQDSNPFSAERTPFEKPRPPRTQVSDAARILLIQATLITASQMKKLFLTREKGKLTLKSSRWVKRFAFVRNSVSAITSLLMKLGK
jgi:hypothetical protein